MKKGALTVFLALSLSIFLGFCVWLIEMAIQNQQRTCFQSIVDVAMDSVLGEYSLALKERYGLFYVDTSYLGERPSVENLQRHLKFYVDANMTGRFQQENAPWGYLISDDIFILSFETATAMGGGSLRNQAVHYMNLSPGNQNEIAAMEEAWSCFEKAECGDAMADWNNLMEQIAAMELPQRKNKEGILEEISLGNPADWVYALSENDILFLCEAQSDIYGTSSYPVQTCLSNRGIQKDENADRNFQENHKLFIAYLFKQFGRYRNYRENSVLQYQLEYLLYGKEGDYDNFHETVETIFQWKMWNNSSLALSDGMLYENALSYASQLQVVQLKPEFLEPVAKSILYGCAFLESVSDVNCLLQEGKVPVQKTSHNMSVSDVIDGIVYMRSGGEGLSYEQYLVGMLSKQDIGITTMRAMDIMEMDIRHITNNPFFQMDYCVERFCAEISACGAYQKTYCTRRKYGYY